MYYSSIGLLAVLLLFIVNRDILRGFGASYEKPVWNICRKFLLAVLVYYVTDILWGVLESLKLPGLLFADTTAYFAAMAVSLLFWAEFTVAYLGEDGAFGRLLVAAGRITAGLITLFAAVNLFVPILFTVDGDCHYRALPLRYAVLGVQIALLLALSLHAFSAMLRSDGEAGERRRYPILSTFGVIVAVCLFAQLLFPELPLYSIAYMLGTCLLHSFIADDEKEEQTRERQEAERAVEWTETITSVLDNIPGLTYAKDAGTGVYVACNQAFAEYANKEDPDAVVGHTDAELFDAETAAHFAADDKTALSMNRPYIIFDDVQDAAGNQRQLQTTKLKYRDAFGRLCVLGVCQDVTDMVRIRHENAMTREAYEKAASSGLMFARIAKALAEDYTDLFYVNADSEEFIEYRRGENGGALTETRRGWHFFSDCRAELAEKVYPEDRDAFLRALKRKTLMQALKQSHAFVTTYRQLGAEGPVYVSMKVSRMADDDQFLIVGISDVDAEMRDAMARNEALSEALNAAKEANRAKISFLSSMSHEIRTPMNAIIGLDTLALKKTAPDAEVRQYLEKIGESARGLLALINDILELNRMDSGRATLREEEFSFRDLLERLNAVFTSRCAGKGLRYTCCVLREPDEVYIGDEAKLRDVLQNLLTNAVQFTEAPGSIVLTVERTERTEEHSVLRFGVKDTGVGMSEEFLPHVFEPFAQENGRGRSADGGTGMGMAIAKRFTELMNGSIAVRSEKGVGTEFAVTVRLKNSAQRGAAPETPVDLRALDVLVVDDSPVDVEHARTVLEEAGIRAETCTSGQEALRLVEARHQERRPYDLVLMDWNMPGMNGLEASAEIRKQFGDESAVVVMTAYNWDDIREEARRVGVDSFLSKPLLPDNVIGQFRRIVRQTGRKPRAEKKRADLAGRRVLLAEDMEINAEILMETLEMENIKADHAENGLVAVRLFQNSAPGTYAAILMDVRMPEMDGLEAVAAIRALKREDARRIPIIALTANAFDEDVQRSLQAGMNAHLTKPIDTELLVRVLGELVYQAEKDD